MTMNGDIPVAELIREFWAYSIHGMLEQQEAERREATQMTPGLGLPGRHVPPLGRQTGGQGE